jgi:hypothetical protein
VNMINCVQWRINYTVINSSPVQTTFDVLISWSRVVNYKQVYYHQYVSGFEFTFIKVAYALSIYVYTYVLKTVFRMALLFFSFFEFVKTQILNYSQEVKSNKFLTEPLQSAFLLYRVHSPTYKLQSLLLFNFVTNLLLKYIRYMCLR